MKRFEHQWTDFKWVDIEGPKVEDLVALSHEFPMIPAQTLMTCLDPEHIPSAEFFDKCLFIVLRHHDVKVKNTAATMQELTTKLVLFVGKHFVLTLHRVALPCTEDKKTKAAELNHTVLSFVRSMALMTIKSFEPPLDVLDSKTTVIEERVFSLKRESILREGYIVKRKASSYKKTFKFTADVFHKIPQEVEVSLRDLALIRDPLSKLIFYAEDIYEEITGLLNLHLSLMSQKTNEASYRTNEVMRVLTVFSIFFLPLNFIAGIYGMNFEYMPELHSQYGYFYTIGLMIAIVLGITFWIYKKGWMRKEDI